MKKEHPPINMRFLRRSLKKQEPGDIFVFQLLDLRYVFGRVIRNVVMPSMFPSNMEGEKGQISKFLLIYIYSAVSNDKHTIPNLNKNDLLIPPQIINRLGWIRGYFETIEHRSLEKDEVLERHCFLSPPVIKGGQVHFFDEYNNILPGRAEPCGIHGVGNYRVVDDLVSKALRIPLAPKE